MFWRIEDTEGHSTPCGFLLVRTVSCLRCGQSTVEAAFCIPVLFVLMLMLIQPGIILYDRMVMRAAAADGCRMLATWCDDGELSQDRCIELVKRHLGAVPSQDLFHMHDGRCSWEVVLEGDEHCSQVGVTVRNRLKLLPLFDAAGAFAGIADDGCLEIEVVETAKTQPDWISSSAEGLDPGAWVTAREKERE
jgi:hypothetical protein